MEKKGKGGAQKGKLKKNTLIDSTAKSAKLIKQLFRTKWIYGCFWWGSGGGKVGRGKLG